MINRILILFIFILFILFPLSTNIFTDIEIKKGNVFKSLRKPELIQNNFSEAINSVAKSVVGISAFSNGTEEYPWEIKDGIFYPYRKKINQIKNLGSGLIYSNNGYIITNTHVIQNSNKIFVTLTGGQQVPAKIIGQDSLTDIALLKIDVVDLPVSALGSPNNLIVGDWVIALGNPLGLFDLSYQPTATIGIVSGLNIDFGIKDNGYVYKNMIQTDASINEGNSGGPLINSKGEVIGLNTFIMTGSNNMQGSIGIGFSIPIDQVTDIAHDLILYGEVKRTYKTGLTLKPINKYLINYLKIPFNYGVVITDIEKNSTALQSKLKIGDVIFKVDDIIINSNQDFLNTNRENLRKAGEIINLEVWRNDSLYYFELEL